MYFFFLFQMWHGLDPQELQVSVIWLLEQLNISEITEFCWFYENNVNYCIWNIHMARWLAPVIANFEVLLGSIVLYLG